MGWAQIIYLALVGVNLGLVIAKHGQPREPYDIYSYLLGLAIGLSLLYWGGFFS